MLPAQTTEQTLPKPSCKLQGGSPGVKVALVISAAGSAWLPGALNYEKWQSPCARLETPTVTDTLGSYHTLQ